jgi:hypothetical protein
MSYPSRYFQLVSARPYLNDYKTLSDFPYVRRQLTLILLKTTLLESNQILVEYTKHLEKSIEAEKNNEDIDDFNFEYAINRQYDSFIKSIVKNTLIFCTKKLLELQAVLSLPIEIADKLTKDTYLSAVRKLERYKNLSEASSQIFFMTWIASAPYSVASVIVEFGFYFYDNMNTKKNKKNSTNKDSNNFVNFASKTLLMYSFGSIMSSTGYAVGCLIHPYYAAPLLAAAGDLIVSTSIGACFAS